MTKGCYVITHMEPIDMELTAELIEKMTFIRFEEDHTKRKCLIGEIQKGVQMIRELID